MKFLTLLKNKPVQPSDPKMIVAINEGVKAWIKANLANGKLDNAFNVVPNSSGYFGMGIANGASLEDVFALLVTYPAFPFTDFEVYPLSDVNRAIDAVNAAIKSMT